jgi:hypothetical protein
MSFHFRKFVVLTIAWLALGALIVQGQSSDRENRAVTVVDEASLPIYHLYVSNVDQDEWGPDQLGIFQTIDPNRYRVFDMDDGSGHCLYDIQAVLSDGRKATTRNFNVCTKGTWTVVDN